MRSGKPFVGRLFTGLTRPKSVPGDVLAGEVVAVGKDVTAFRPGDRVFGSSGTNMGALAEFNCLPQDAALALMPTNLDYAEAAAISDGGLTALPFLRDRGKIQKGQKVLINGASGAVGTAAVQLAKYFGAEVTAVCGPANLQLVRSIGADMVIDYTTQDFTASASSYDIIFDAVGKSSYAKCKGVLKEGGIYLTTMPTLPIMLRRLWPEALSSKHARFAATGLRAPAEKSKDLAFLKKLSEEGKLRPLIDKRYRLEEIAEAHRYVGKGHKKGNVVMLVG
jgi:NADPH:quinone reductase-like Zn-dependent oxidoreductase